MSLCETSRGPPAAAVFYARIGGARCGKWFWDTEDDVRECKLPGMDREAEIDIIPEGVFSELELVYDFAKVPRWSRTCPTWRRR